MGNDHKLYVKNIFTNEFKASLPCAAVQLLNFSEMKGRSNISSDPNLLVLVLTGYTLLSIPVGLENLEKSEIGKTEFSVLLFCDALAL